MALITDLITSRDGEIRSAMLQTSIGRIVQRPINRLIPLEIHSSTRSLEEQADKSPTVAKRTRRKTPSRPAKKADVVIRQQPPRAAKNQVSYNDPRAEPKSAHSSSSALLMITMCALALPNPVSATAISCSDKGAKINTTLSSKAKLCINYKECTIVPDEASITEVALPFEHLISQHTIQWRTIVDSRQYTETIVCPPGDVCKRINCIMCIEFLGNPHCAPRMVIAMLAVAIAIVLVPILLICYTTGCYIIFKQSSKRRGKMSMRARIPMKQPKDSLPMRQLSFPMRQLPTLPRSSKIIIFSIVMIHLIAIEKRVSTHILSTQTTQFALAHLTKPTALTYRKAQLH
ncbi:hypothetical protein V3C99_004798 [Haemonchus contortus]